MRPQGRIFFGGGADRARIRDRGPGSSTRCTFRGIDTPGTRARTETRTMCEPAVDYFLRTRKRKLPKGKQRDPHSVTAPNGAALAELAIVVLTPGD